MALGTMRPTLFAWNFAGERGERLEALCRRLGLALYRVSPAQAGLPLGKLADSTPTAGPAAMPFPEEMLLMAGLGNSQVDALLAGLRQAGLAPVPLKAVLTPFNALWDSLQLHRELTGEARRFSGT